MKSQSSLTSILISSVIMLANGVSAQNLSADEIYHQAKIAYEKPDCQSTLVYLNEYLKVGSSSGNRLTSIRLVMKWCKKFLTEGVEVSRGFGLMPSVEETEITEQGRKMLKKMPMLEAQ